MILHADLRLLTHQEMISFQHLDQIYILSNTLLSIVKAFNLQTL